MLQSVVIKMDKIILYDKALKKWGKTNQLKQTTEELAELIVAICKLGRSFNGKNKNDVAEEIADVEIMIEQTKIILDVEYSSSVFKMKKLNRLEQLVSD